jgi:hypothetical protein
MDMDRAARLFLCARCRDQVLLCSHCDRGQQYCSRACSGMSRRERRREAAQRYQSSRRGQLKHAARTASWRDRRRSLRRDSAKSLIDKVTHQGCPDETADASLLACDTPRAGETPKVADSANDTVPALAGTVAFAVLVCRRCAHRLLPHVRQGFLRSRCVGWRGGHDHPT